MAKAKRDEAEIQAVVDELPIRPPEYALNAAKKQLNGAMLVYRVGWYRDPLTGMKEKSALVRCTNCGSEMHLEHVSFYADIGCSRGYGPSDSFGFIDPADKAAKRTGDTCICPMCGHGAKAIHVSKIRDTHLIESVFFATIHNIRGHLAVLSWRLAVTCDKEARVRYEIGLYEGIGVIGGVPVRFTGYEKTMFYGVSWKKNWCARPVFKDNVDRFEREAFPALDIVALEASEASHSALDVYIEKGGDGLRVAAYLQLWCKYPQVENLVRSGYSKYVTKLIEAMTEQSGYSYTCKETFKISKTRMYIDVKKKKPHEMLGLEKCEMHFVNVYDPPTLMLISWARKLQKIRLSDREIQDARNLGTAGILELITEPIAGYNPPVVRTIGYLMRQKSKNDKYRFCINPEYFRDYLTMLHNVYGSFPQELIFPKDLHAAHDEMSLRVKEKVDREINEKIEEFAKTLESLSFHDEGMGLSIRPCQNQEELIKEGKILSHCVGTYAKRIAARETAILLIRRDEAPEVPFYTLEYKKGVVVQNRGKKNCARTPEVEAFESEWLEHIKNKEIVKNGKSNSRSTQRQRAGA